MQENNPLILLFLAMMVVTYIPRVLPLTILSKIKLPKLILEVLDYIPIAILGALLLPSLFYIDGQIDISLNNLYLIAGILTAVISIFTKKLYLIVSGGILIMFLLINFY